MAMSFVYAHIPGSRAVAKQGSEKGMEDMIADLAGFSESDSSTVGQHLLSDVSRLARCIGSASVACVSFLLVLTAWAGRRMFQRLHRTGTIVNAIEEYGAEIEA